ncbi:uncharacterized protein LOC135688035 [Rhopilema esculentum]|uniref:uncharacterized protein LOC135688035 n=1 Tax=Rhopilema esculentum TaxID=499914 RepID=UPI0031D1ABB5|eukprot:gene6911-12523_t
MATRSIVPLARLSNVAREKLHLILSGKEIRQSAESRSEGQECRGFSEVLRSGYAYGNFESRKNSEKNPVIVKRGNNSSETISVNEGFKRYKSDSKVSCKKLDKNLSFGTASSGMLEDGGEKIEKQRLEKNSSKSKKRRIRVFRRFMRSAACYEENEGNFSKSLSSTSLNRHDQVAIESCGPSTSLENKSELTLDQQQIASKIANRVDTDNSFEKIPLDDVGENISWKTCLRFKGEKHGTHFKWKDCTSMAAEDSKNSKLADQQITNQFASIKGSKERSFKVCFDSLEQDCIFEEKEILEPEIKVDKRTKILSESDEDYNLDILFDDSVCSKQPTILKCKQRGGSTKRQKQKSEKKDKVKGSLQATDNENPNEMVERDTKLTQNDKNRKDFPNYFLAIKVDDSYIADNVNKVQESVVNEEPAFRHVLIPIPTLHLTLFVMKLDDESEVLKAKEALCHSELDVQNCFANSTKELTFNGVRTFRNKVVYVGIDKDTQSDALSCLRKAVDVLVDSFCSHGINLAKNTKDQFVPHVTVIKLSKNIKKMKKKGIKRVDDRFLKDFLDLEFGKQKFSEVLLCSMVDKKGEDGFYKIIDRISLGQNNEGN